MTESSRHSSKPVVACIDGGDDGDRALRYAIGEARRRGTGIRLVHVPPEILPYAPVSPMFKTPNLRDIGSHILKDAFERCTELAPELFVEGTMATGHRVGSIVEESADAAAVVLGTRQWRASRSFGGSTTVSVSARAHCPVIAVPPRWRPGTSTGRVVVGVDALAEPTPVLRHAFEAARTGRAALTIVHAWGPPHAYAPAFGTFDADEWRRTVQSSLEERTTAIRAEYADVPTTVVATFSSDKTEVPDLASDSDLLVLGRHRHTRPLHRLGSVALHAIHAGTCPVEIVPLQEEPAPEDDLR